MAYSPSSNTNDGGFPISSSLDFVATNADVLQLAGQSISSQGLAAYKNEQEKRDAQKTQLAQGCAQSLESAYDFLENLANRAIQQPNSLSHAEIRILAAFVLGVTSK